MAKVNCPWTFFVLRRFSRVLSRTRSHIHTDPYALAHTHTHAHTFALPLSLCISSLFLLPFLSRFLQGHSLHVWAPWEYSGAFPTELSSLSVTALPRYLKHTHAYTQTVTCLVFCLLISFLDYWTRVPLSSPVMYFPRPCLAVWWNSRFPGFHVFLIILFNFLLSFPSNCQSTTNQY